MNKRLLIVLMVVAVIVAALPVNVGAQEGEGPAQVGLRPDSVQVEQVLVHLDHSDIGTVEVDGTVSAEVLCEKLWNLLADLPIL